MHQRFDWNLKNAFSTIDITNDGFINHRNIQMFLKNIGFYANDEHLIAIIRRLDSDADQKVIFQEFSESLSLPGAPGNYIPQ